MRNTVCKNCGEKFHTCGNCDLFYDWEWKYCSEDCWIKSKEYKEKQIVTQFANSE